MDAEQERWECPSCGTPLNIAALGIYAKVACPACGHVDHVHTMLANLRIEGVLGLGGMSVVLRARDLVLERPLAIKLLNEFYRDQPERIARFEQECELMAKVRHENVVSLYSAGRVKGQFYIAMELINGRNLEELVLAEGPMEALRALDILRQVVLGLQAAWKAGLLHRDMKPANILICENDHAKVLDFGLSHGRRDADTEEIIWATPYYVPPETLMREPEDLRTDIYALGMTLRHLLTGKGNFEPAPETVEAMLECKRALPRMAEAMPALPEAYAELVDHMTAYAPEGRPENYASLLEEIAEVRAVLVAEKLGLPPAARLKSALPLLGGALVTLALGLGAACLARYVVTPQPELLYAVPAEPEWAEQALLADAMARLQQGEAREAAMAFLHLAEQGKEPAACAWAALHANALGALTGEPLRDYLAWHLERQPAPAGQAVFEQIAALSQPDSAPENSFLQAAQALRRMKEAEHACRETEARAQLQAARKALRAAGEAYAPMLELLGAHEAAMSANMAGNARWRYINTLSLLDVGEASRLLGLMEASAADAAARSRLAVQKEALSLYAEAVEMMKRRQLMPADGRKVYQAKQLAELLEPLGNQQLTAELAALMYMAHGEFERAAQVNPYAHSADSREPFAVLMRDWLRRLE